MTDSILDILESIEDYYKVQGNSGMTEVELVNKNNVRYCHWYRKLISGKMKLIH